MLFHLRSLACTSGRPPSRVAETRSSPSSPGSRKGFLCITSLSLMCGVGLARQWPICTVKYCISPRRLPAPSSKNGSRPPHSLFSLFCTGSPPLLAPAKATSTHSQCPATLFTLTIGFGSAVACGAGQWSRGRRVGGFFKMAIQKFSKTKYSRFLPSTFCNIILREWSTAI